MIQEVGELCIQTQYCGCIWTHHCKFVCYSNQCIQFVVAGQNFDQNGLKSAQLRLHEEIRFCSYPFFP